MDGAVPWRETGSGLALQVRVTPKGGRDALDGVEIRSDGRPVLRVRVRALPEGGAANDAVRRCVAAALGCPVSAVNVTSGATARVKTLSLSGDAASLARTLEALCGGAAA